MGNETVIRNNVVAVKELVESKVSYSGEYQNRLLAARSDKEIVETEAIVVNP